MSKRLAGTLFIYNGESQDYCYLESIRCLQEFCDHVFVVDAGSLDGTVSELNKIKDDNTTIVTLFHSEWLKQYGKKKLNYFTNISIKEAQDADYEYQFNLQADEIVHEKSYDAIRRAIETGQEAFMCSRINLWQSPYMRLDVPQERKPCSTSIIRLAKTNYRSVDDAENLEAPANFDFLNDIIIYHMGFVRKRDVMKKKIIHIQEQIFGTDHDKKLDGSDIFIPERWFEKEDLKPIDEPLPKIIQQWAKERYYE
jgi:hypothetical protein